MGGGGDSSGNKEILQLSSTRDLINGCICTKDYLHFNTQVGQ